ncbi:hypothetical protein [Undibacterium flavidum]|uniref:Secreted protein n=1 Tax=Undibacterium flavidum TaxID=2762297 RepID=A0ABR6Y9Z3_9BURK|nr:hypothetical protein [Undibacterium flavidum]MBC3873389.1 hypothetical protein [Undibacterium flavidum]
MKNISPLLVLALLSTTVISSPACAACLDPKTLVSGYRVPLESEIRSSQAIVIGKLIKTSPLQEDHDDPDGVTAHLHTIRVVRQLKGHLPAVVTVREENDSSRYTMRSGEKHLFFFTKSGSTFRIDSCGNSWQLPQGADVLKQVEAQLRSKSMHSNNSFKSKPLPSAS